MTKRDLFRILIKLFGVYSLILSLFSILPSSISYLFGSYDVVGIIWILFIFALICLGFVVLILKTDKLIDYLKLDKGFDDETIILGNLSVNKIVMLGSFIIGGLLLINSVPNFLSHTYYAFKSSFGENSLDIVGKIGWLNSFLNIVIGYLMVTNYEWLANKLTKKELQD